MKKSLFILINLLINLTLLSQQDGTIDQVEIKIVKDYNVFIEEANKINIPVSYNPQFKDKSTQKPLTYQLPDRIEQFKFEPSELEPSAYQSKEIIINNRNFFKIGLGTILNPILEWSHVKLNKKTPYKIHVLHNSAFLGNDSFQKFSETKGRFNFSTNYNNWTINPQLTLQHKLYNFYGNTTESSFKNESSRSYGNIDAIVSIDKEKTDLKSISIKNQARINFGLDNLNQNGNANSNNEVLTSIANTLTYKYSDAAKINLASGIQYYSFKFDTFTDKWLINTKPTVEYKAKALKVSGGLDFVYAMINSNGSLLVFPKLETELQLIPNFVNFYSLWERKIEMNTHQSSLVLNPFINYTKTLLTNTKVENRSAGIRGAFKGLSYHAYFNQKIMKDALLFKNDSINPRYFISEVERNMTQNNVSIEIAYQKQNLWSAYIKGDLFLYEMDNLPVAYNLPGQRISFGANLVASKKLNLSTNLFAIGGVKSIIQGKQITNPIAFDLNFGGEFLISKNFYIFANLNNILNSKISPQIGYYSYGINGQTGLRFIY